MSETKKFLLILAVASLAVWLGANMLIGPPGLSRAYLDKYKAQHDHYLEIAKSTEYKLYSQRPDLHPDSCPQADIDFVAQYTANAEFQAEQRRQTLYDLFFDVFNMSLVVILFVRFGKKPFLKFVDEKIVDLREKVETAAEARRVAEQRRQQSEAHLAQLPDERKEVEEDTRKRLERELAELEEANQHSRQVIMRELADRKRKEEYAAATLMKRELVNQAIARMVERYRAQDSPEHQAALIQHFVGELEKRV